MEYNVHELAKLAGVSARTLRYYDNIGLLSPSRNEVNGYRVYGRAEVSLLQQIMFYRSLGVPAGRINDIMDTKGYDRLSALQEHLTALEAERERLGSLITNIKNTISEMKGELTMSDGEKFEGFKKKLIDENENSYGREAREKYGDAAVDESNARFAGLSPDGYARMEALSAQISAELPKAMRSGDPAGEAAQHVCALHREWLGFFWNDYSKEKHLGLGKMYVEDPRFKAYYDAMGDGCAEFLYKALEIYCK